MIHEALAIVVFIFYIVLAIWKKDKGGCVGCIFLSVTGLANSICRTLLAQDRIIWGLSAVTFLVLFINSIIEYKQYTEGPGVEEEENPEELDELFEAYEEPDEDEDGFDLGEDEDEPDPDPEELPQESGQEPVAIVKQNIPHIPRRRKGSLRKYRH